jgi:glycosyltransferase involved in cell wall biosynthesis
MLSEYATEFADAELILVLNGCTDGTLQVVKAFSASHPHIRIIEIAEALGKGGAIRAGMKLARADVVGYVDADGSTPAKEMRRLCNELKDDDGVIASRWLPGSLVTGRPIKRRIASSAFNVLVRIFFQLPFSDTQCGAKVFRRATLLEVFDQLETSGLAFDVDLLHCLASRRKRVREVPTVWHDVMGSRIHLVDASVAMFISLLRLRLRNSILRALIPAFDRWLPTKPMRAHDRLNILLINWRDPKHPKAGGAEQYCYHVARSLVDAGHHVEWLTAGFPGAAKHEVIDGVSITRVGNSVTVYALAAIEYLRAMRDRFHVIIDSENGIPFFTPLFSLKPKVLLVYHVHRDVFLSQLPFPLSHLMVFVELKLVPLLYRNVSIVTISPSTKRDLERYGKTRLPIEIVEPGISGHFAVGDPAKDPTVLYVGRIEPYKRLDLLIKAFSKVLSDIPNAQLRIAGAGSDLENVKQLAAREGIASHVAFLGHVTESRKAEELASAWVFVNPSSMEGWGISVLEAAASGTPSVAFDVPGLSDSIVPGVTGALVSTAENSDLVRGLATAIASYLQAPELCRRHGGDAAERARKYAWANQAAKFRELVVSRALNMPYHLVRKDGEWYLFSAADSAGSVRSLIDGQSRSEAGLSPALQSASTVQE